METPVADDHNPADRFRPADSAFEPIVEAVFKFLSDRVPRSMWHTAMDVGCGPGRCSQLLCEQFTRVFGIETSAYQNESEVQIKCLPPPNARFQVKVA